MRAVSCSISLSVALLSLGQQWQPRDIAPCTSAEMTAAGAGFCEEYVYLSSSSGGQYTLYGTEDDWSTTAQLVAAGGFPQLFCSAGRLTRVGPNSLGHVVSCGPVFIATASYANGNATTWDDIGGAYVDAVIAHDFSGDSLLFWVGQRGPDLFIERLRLGGVNGAVTEVSTVLVDSTIVFGTMDFYDSDHGVMALRNSSGSTSISMTLDGGVTWQIVQSSNGPGVNDVEFLDDHTVWAVGDQGSIHVSTDTGLTWQSITPPTPFALWSVDGYSADSVWVAGQNGIVFATGSGGLSWTTMLPLPGSVREIQTLDGAVYGHTGNGVLYRYFAAGDPNGIEEGVVSLIGSSISITLGPNEVLRSSRAYSSAGLMFSSRSDAQAIMLDAATAGLYVVVAETNLRQVVGRVLWTGE